MGFHLSGTWEMVRWIAYYGGAVFFGMLMILWALVSIYGTYGLALFLCIFLPLLYRRHPQRHPKEFDDKLPADRWEAAREEYILGVRMRIVEDQDR